MDLKELEGNRYYKLVKVEDKEQLEEIGWDWLLEVHPYEDLKGNYFVTEEEREEVNGKEVEVSVVYTVDRYLYIEPSKAIECDDGSLWLSEEEMERHL